MKLLPLSAAIVLLLTSCTPNGIDGRLQVALVGDSYTNGVINDASIPPDLPTDERTCYLDQCFAAIVEAYLADRGVATARIGAGGATSRDYDPNDFRTLDPHFIVPGRELFSFVPAANVVVVLLGINDAVGFFENNEPVPPEEYAQHMLDFAITLLARGVEEVVIVTAPTPRSWRRPHPAEDRLDAYSDLVRRMEGQVRGVRVIDLARSYPADEWFGEAIHPTVAGHRVIADEIIAQLEDQMRLELIETAEPHGHGRGALRRARPHALRGPILAIPTPDPNVDWEAEAERLGRGRGRGPH